MRNLLWSWRFLIHFSLIVLVNMVVVSGQCRNDQKSILLQLKTSLKFDNSSSRKLMTWKEGTDCCSWRGVTCTSGRVIGLDLSNEAISEGIEISSALFRLQYLQNLSLAFNDFQSIQVPSMFGNLSNLVYLNLSNTGFSGQIPNEISQLRRLAVLDLSTTIYFTRLTSLKLENPNLTMFIQNFSELSELYLDGVNISATEDQWCQALSASLPKLKVLSMSNCRLSGPIDPSLVKLRFLSAIYLDNNNLSTGVPEFLANFSNLRLLRMSASKLTGRFPQKIFQVQTLRTLDISSNLLLEGNVPEFPENGSLENLVLSNTLFSGELPESIGNLRMLSRLELMNCTFSGHIPSSLSNLSKLVFVDLSSNRFIGAMPSFSLAMNLSELNLAHNLLNGTISSANWSSLSNLANLNLRNNLLSGRIPHSLFEIPSLRKIQLSHNQFSGQLTKFHSGYISLLDTLDIGSNNLSGQLPVSIFRLKGLKILTLSSNNFSGPLQLNMAQQLQNLSSLDLSYNSLSINIDGINLPSASFPNISTLRLASCNLKSFPQFLKHQTKLNYLDLSDNKMDGEIPSWIWELNGLSYLNLSRNFLVKVAGPLQNSSSSLFVLDLHSNRLQGPIPVLPKLATYLDYSSNHLSSFIPNDIGDYLNITVFFSLSNNSFQGIIPESMCKAENLQVLDLSNNRLSGKIPDCLTAKNKNLVVLNLRKNNLTEKISLRFPENCHLKTLDLNGNLLEGRIPQSLANCRTLEVLDLGNNQLTNGFPCWLKNISSLRVLVLRANRFNGPFECPQSNTSWPRLQIVDIASNYFSGNLPSRCLENWKAMMMADEDQTQSMQNHLRYEYLSLSQLYYQDTVTVTSKGLQMELVKILTVFTSIDFSGNKFEGPIPEEIGKLKDLYVLNMSHNILTGPIPSSLGKLRQLESLDLSCNKLNGTIPVEIASLSFLSVMDVSQNQLVGKIPTGTQLQLLPEASFEGNPGLCGLPINVSCTGTSKYTPKIHPYKGLKGFNWQFIFIGLGVGVGAGVAVATLMFWGRGSKWCDDHVDKILALIFPMFGFVYVSNDERKKERESFEDESTDSNYDHEKDPAEDDGVQGQYCVFCSKLDFTRKKVIHNPSCTCYRSLLISTTTSYSSV